MLYQDRLGTQNGRRSHQSTHWCARVACAQGVSIRRLELANNSLTDDGLVPLARALAACHSLECIDLSENRIRSDGCEALVRNTLFFSIFVFSFPWRFLASQNFSHQSSNETLHFLAFDCPFNFLPPIQFCNLMDSPLLKP